MVTLEASKLFCRLNAESLAALRRISREQVFEAGQEIFKEGDAGDGIYIVREGLVEISGLIGQNARHVFSQIEAGDVFGEMAVIEDKPRSACAVAREKTIVSFLPRAEMLQLVESTPALAVALLREICGRLREFDRQYLGEVVQAERLAVVGRFARTIIHDLKNPLNVIGLLAEVAELARATPEQRQNAVRGIRQQLERVNEMVAEILEFTQGPCASLVSPVNYRAFVRQVLEELRPEAVLRSAVLELENEPPQLMVPLNPKRLRRVFFNLAGNAADAMPLGGKIRLRFQAKPAEVITEIQDSGPGIAPEIAGRLFEPFASYGKNHGTGLGLSICKRILEDHHGWITARNAPAQGAIFAFGLPRAEQGPGN